MTKRGEGHRMTEIGDGLTMTESGEGLRNDGDVSFAGLRIRTLALATVLALSIAAARILAGTPPKPAREMAVTFDDLPGVVAPGEGTAELSALTEKLLRAIVSARIPAVGFVNEGKLVPAGSRDPERVALLGKWVFAGLELGNHTYSHLDLHRVPLEQFRRGRRPRRGGHEGAAVSFEPAPPVFSPPVPPHRPLSPDTQVARGVPRRPRLSRCSRHAGQFRLDLRARVRPRQAGR